MLIFVLITMNLWYRIWIYLLPLPLWLAEFFVRTVMRNPDVNNFFPSNLAAIALGMLIPVISPKTPSARKNSTVSHVDEAVRQIGTVTLFLGTFLWLGTVYLCIGGEWPSGWIGEHINLKFWGSFVLYITASVLTEWKERI